MATKQSKIEYGDEFSEWLRNQKELDSQHGTIVTDIDFMLMNYKNDKYILLETKRMFGCRKENKMTYSQRQMFKILDKNCKNDSNYKGFFTIKFENTCPTDGRMWVNEMEYTEEQLIKFLKLNW